MELWDAYNINFFPIPGASLTRGEPISEGLYHLVSEILVRHTDGDFLLMQRAESKHLGGLWEATAGGSALCGENGLTCAQRELTEETGVTGIFSPLGMVRHDGHHTHYAMFLCVTDCDKASVRLQAGETAAYRWVSREELLRMPCCLLASTRTLQFV